MLFLIALSYMPTVTQSASVTSYGDDIKISPAIKDQVDVIRLQIDLNFLYNWVEINDIQCNALKFNTMDY